LGLAGPHIAGNGCVVFRDSETRQLAALGPVVQEITSHLMELGIPFISYSLQGLFGHPALIGEPHFQAFRELQEPRPLLEEPGSLHPVFKVLTFLEVQETEKEKDLRAAAQDWGVAPVRTSSRFLEFLPLESGKGAAVVEVLKQVRWPQFHSLAIGDSENDLSMFRVVGRSAAVGNAGEEISRSADLVTADCREDGVARILERILRERDSLG
jgi:hydroxymethylpyrimidine pyrophosphatase-like HAD family hydrolase